MVNRGEPNGATKAQPPQLFDAKFTQKWGQNAAANIEPNYPPLKCTD